MKELIFGSVALKHWFSDLNREPHDLDVISEKQLVMTKKEQHYWWPFFEYVLENNKDEKYVDPNFLYTIKVAHACWDIWWDKTIHDIMFLKRKGCELDKELFDMAMIDFAKDHRDKKINMNISNEEFFNSTVTRKYEHDYLHEVFAFYDRPLHEKINVTKGKPLSSEKKWKRLNQQDQMKCVLEEIYVIATERFIPMGMPPKYAKLKAMKNLILTMTKGWFNLYLIDNFEELLTYNDDHWIAKMETL